MRTGKQAWRGPPCGGAAVERPGNEDAVCKFVTGAFTGLRHWAPGLAGGEVLTTGAISCAGERAAVGRSVESSSGRRGVVGQAASDEPAAAMLPHFTSRSPEMVRREGRLWCLRDLHDVELWARCIPSKANVTVGVMARSEGQGRQAAE
ncbi:hypothetical protein CYMTET_51961 [Cymbomonas tetramitiformis]|uniref:Uncharacterized protein n=1 Tax=Cymbomonas tetramitiformis TaxID=36881 RepID=A0AAE0BK21_9CHLO|nr:hypothetical protein CYMTET_51961 [Cymbomonas tetramitiformis]